MATRTLYAVRHGSADALGNLTDAGREQSRLLGRRLAHLPIDALWHSPLARAVDSARLVAEHFDVGHSGSVLVDEAAELIDHVPHVPSRESLAGSDWAGFFDGYDQTEAQAGRRIADALTTRFATPPSPGDRSTHEVLVTHAYPVAWLVREVLGAPPQAWLSLAGIANTALTVVELTSGEPPSVRQVNDQSHLPDELRWTGFARGRTP